MAFKAYRGVRYIKGLVNSEKHHTDFSIGGTSPNTTPSTQQLTAIAQGDEIDDRTGNSIFVRGITWRFCLELHASATATQVRMVLVKDNQQGADSAPSWTTVFSSAAIDSLLNIQTLGRFTILKDKTYLLDAVNRRQIFEKGFYPMKYHVRFNGTTSSDIQKNGLYLMYMSNEATNTPTLDGVWRTNFYDN